MARDGMANLISRLRSMCDAGTADYSLAGGETYWSDDQLQDALDAARTDVRRELLTIQPDYVGGSVEYHDYYWQHADVEELESGSAAWLLADSSGAEIGTALYTVNYRAQHIRFDASTGGTSYFLSYRSFDLERAAAEVWETKAAHVSTRYDVSSDNHSLKRSQLREGFLQMAKIHRRRQRARTVEMFRGDTC